jgi:26S proteasome regulatory subunit N3
VKTFELICQKYHQIFENDGNLILIKRLTLNVIRAGLKRINISYSRISFEDIRTKLGLPDSTDVESMVAKAIRDGVITARIDFDTQSLFINETNNIYVTKEPQINFQKRIEYCTNLINNCNGALQYK